MNQALRERLHTLYAALKLGQLDFILNAFDEEIEFISYSPVKIFPFLGHRRGKPAVAEALRGAHAEFEFLTCEPVAMVLEAEQAAVQIFTRVVNRLTGRPVQVLLAHFLRFRDGKIVEVREFMDSYRAAEQVLGRELVPAAD